QVARESQRLGGLFRDRQYADGHAAHTRLEFRQMQNLYVELFRDGVPKKRGVEVAVFQGQAQLRDRRSFDFDVLVNLLPASRLLQDVLRDAPDRGLGIRDAVGDILVKQIVERFDSTGIAGLHTQDQLHLAERNLLSDKPCLLGVGDEAVVGGD